MIRYPGRRIKGNSPAAEISGNYYSFLKSFNIYSFLVISPLSIPNIIFIIQTIVKSIIFIISNQTMSQEHKQFKGSSFPED